MHWCRCFQISLHLFAAVPGVFGNQENQHVDVIKQMLASSLVDQSSFDVRFAAVKATVNYLLMHEKDTHYQQKFQVRNKHTR